MCSRYHFGRIEGNKRKDAITAMKNDRKTNSETTEVPELFTEIEAAKKLRISRFTLQRARLAGKIDFFRIGGAKVFYTENHLQKYLQSQQRQSYTKQSAETF